MYAVVEIAGQQFKVEKNQKLFVHRLENKEGSKVSFEKVYLIDDGKKVSIGTPKINGTFVNAKVLKHLKGDKVVVFKKKRRKGYKVKNGHRQALTELLIESIGKDISSNEKAVVQKELVKTAIVKKKSVKKAVVQKEPVKKAVVQKEPVKKAIVKKKSVKKAVAQKEPAKKVPAAKKKSSK